MDRENIDVLRISEFANFNIPSSERFWLTTKHNAIEKLNFEQDFNDATKGK